MGWEEAKMKQHMDMDTEENWSEFLEMEKFGHLNK